MGQDHIGVRSSGPGGREVRFDARDLIVTLGRLHNLVDLPGAGQVLGFLEELASSGIAGPIRTLRPERDAGDQQDGCRDGGEDPRSARRGRWLRDKSWKIGFGHTDRSHGSKEPVATLGDGLNIERLPGVITQSEADLADAVVKTGIELDRGAVGPQRGLEFFTGDEVTGMLDQKGEQLERLRRELHRPTGFSQFSAVEDAGRIAHPARLLLASPTQINFEVPLQVAPGKVWLKLQRADGTILDVPSEVRTISPGLLTRTGGIPMGYAVRLESNGSQSVVPTIDSIWLDDRPTFLTLYASGIRGRSSLGGVQCKIGDTPCSAQYAGPAGENLPGLDQLNLELPKSLRGKRLLDVQITVDGVSANAVAIDFQ